jgi:uncharacterized membrane protein YqhA
VDQIDQGSTNEPQISQLEKTFENGLWNTRFVVFPAVLCSLLGALLMFIVGSSLILGQVGKMFSYWPLNDAKVNELLGKLIGAIDLYLIGVVLLIFSFGIYELFISKIDVGRRNTDLNILEIRDLDELKNRIIKVVIMVLIVKFFKLVLAAEFTTPLELLYLAIAIFTIALGTYFMHKAH